MEKNNSSYNQILKSTTIFGGSQVLVILIGVFRAKIVAILLGPLGVGVIGIYQSVIDMIRTGSCLGIDTSSVKEIAEANRSKNEADLFKTISVFNLWFKMSALFGLLLCIIFCYPISLWVFDSGDYTPHIALLSLSIFFAILATGKSSVLQGMRRIPLIAKSTVYASLFGLLVAIPLYYFLKIEGIAIAFVLINLISFLCVNFYYKKLNIIPFKVSFKEAFHEGLSSLKLGLFIVVSSFVATVSMFLIRAFIVHNIDLDAAGLFQSVWTITNVYLGLLLKSMGADFFPRLSAISTERDKVRMLVNEQSYVVLVVATPIIVGMLLLSDFALSVLYSSEFTYAGTVLRWQILGTFLKVLGWPVAFILLAKNKGRLFLTSEVLFYAVYLLASYFLFPKYGLDASGIGYLIAYIIYLPVLLIMGKNIAGFSWNSDVVKMIIAGVVLVGSAFYISQYHSQYIVVGGISLIIVSLLYAFFKLKKIFNLNDLKNWFIKKNK